MKDRPSLTLVGSEGSRVDFPLLPETLVRSRTAEGAGERLAFVTYLDDRLGDDTGTTDDTISALTAVSSDASELHWGERHFRVRLADLTVTETAYNEELEPTAATIRLTLDVIPAEDDVVTVMVAGERWRRVPELDRAGPDDRVYELRLGDDGSLQVRFGDGQRGARPPSGEISVRARYTVGGGNPGR
jgi:hypothetical protein